MVGKVGLEPTALEILSFLRMPFRHNPVNGRLCGTRTHFIALKEQGPTHNRTGVKMVPLPGIEPGFLD